MLWMMLVVVAIAGPVGAVIGDLNRDGRVDLTDFFIFSDNFGLEGAPEPVGVDTVTVVQTVRDTTKINFLCEIHGEPVFVDPEASLSPAPVELRGIGVFAFYVHWTDNWDADIDGDGFSVSPIYRDEKGNGLFIQDGVERLVNFKLFVGTRAWSDVKRDDEPFTEVNVIVDTGVIRIPFESIDPVPTDAVRNSELGDNEPLYFIDAEPDDQKVVNLVVEITISFQDGRAFADRAFTMWKVAMVDGDWRLHHVGDPND